MSDPDKLLAMFEDLEHAHAPTREKLLKAPFGYPGGKWRSCKNLLPHLPQRSGWCEVFGGSGVVTLNRHPSKLEVFNDAYSGVTDFYRCLKDKTMMNKMMDWLNLTVHSREEFMISRDTWKNVKDPVERASRWYYMHQYSFARLERNFGRATAPSARLAGLVPDKLKAFPTVHDRFRNVQVENQDWSTLVHDYDHEDMVFYMDPDYPGTDPAIYKSHVDHHALLRTIFELKGFVAVSGYSHPLYEKQDWDERHEWESCVSMQSLAYQDTSNKADRKGVEQRGTAKEVLWIKEAK
jgi:DNA adenine methylase